MKKVLLLLFALAPGIISSAQQTRADLIIHSASILDVATGKLITGKAIAVKDDKVIAVFDQRQLSKYDAPQTVDAKGKIAMPGLWDAHMHFGGGDTLAHENKNFLPLFLAYGITSVRDCAADISHYVLQWRDSIRNGQLEGPNIFTSGPKLEGYKSVWKGDIEIGTKEELHHALDSLKGLNVDFIKITDNTLQPDLYLESIREARKRGWVISGHVPYAIPMKEIVDAGISSIEHITYLLKAGSREETEISAQVKAGTLKGRDLTVKVMETYDPASAHKMFSYMAKKGTAVTPTLSLGHILAYFDQDDHQNDPYLQYIGKGIQGTYTGRVNNVKKHDAEAIAFRKASYEKSAAVLPDLQKAGVMILAGTDAGYLNSFTYPGIGLHEELALMVKHGLTPLQALRASVINAPKFLHQEGYGALKAGNKADILLLDANPLTDISNTQKIYGVVSKGKWMDRNYLDRLLETVKDRTAKGI
ncbi:amidohydrolase family protein [Chitinophaga barathri]|uniref:Amidohydrolase n=1 Tax=Chitinophaga barathri TaxID=1647451 RepID=A0A3N4MCE9_9BACT|nr:amidohydrolase family protein [Chitinophaga barathri]RPD41371.1 amidohydrolase [Chitinophaga barathri]